MQKATARIPNANERSFHVKTFQWFLTAQLIFVGASLSAQTPSRECLAFSPAQTLLPAGGLVSDEVHRANQLLAKALVALIKSRPARYWWIDELREQIEKTQALATALSSVDATSEEFGGPVARMNLLMAVGEADFSDSSLASIFGSMRAELAARESFSQEVFNRSAGKALANLRIAALPLRARLAALAASPITYQANEGDRLAFNRFSAGGTEAHRRARQVMARTTANPRLGPDRIHRLDDAQALANYVVAYGQDDAPGGFELAFALDYLGKFDRDYRFESPMPSAVEAALKGIARDFPTVGERHENARAAIPIAIAVAFAKAVRIDLAWAILSRDLRSDPVAATYRAAMTFAYPESSFGSPIPENLTQATRAAYSLRPLEESAAASQTLFVLSLAHALRYESAAERNLAKFGATSDAVRYRDDVAARWQLMSRIVFAYFAPRRGPEVNPDLEAIASAFAAMAPGLDGRRPNLANAMRRLNSRIVDPSLRSNWRDDRANVRAIAALVGQIYQGSEIPARAAGAFARFADQWPEIR